MRGEAFLRMGDLVNAISDYKSSVKMTPDNTKGHLRVSRLHYDIGEAEESLK
jgi:DnaJ family protein C protein 3